MEGNSARHRFLRPALLWIVLGLSACSTLPSTSQEQAKAQRLWNERQPRLTRLQSWNIAGRLALQTHKDGWHVSYRWQQQDQLYHIVLADPLGQTSAELQGTPQGVTLLMADGRSVTADNPDRLLERQLGWSVPVQGLYYWVRGLPVPGTPEAHALDRNGRLIRLKQSGWDISYRRYADFGGLSLPTKIFLDDGRIEVRLVIDGWV